MRRTLKDILSCGLFPNSLKINSLSTNNITTRKFEHHYHSNSESKLEPSIIWEDNQGCIHLANDHLQNRPRTKHISIKWHHFLDQIQKGNIKITKIHTSLNISDILTKPLITSKFIVYANSSWDGKITHNIRLRGGVFTGSNRTHQEDPNDPS
jgi:hypothetical protein